MADEIKKKVLIVDDDKFLLDMYTVKFNENNFDVVAALGSVEALGKIKEGINPDVALLDVVMPAMDGFELLETIKRDKLAPQAKIIILSNLGQQSDIDKGKSLGADGYIVKANSTPSEVVEKVKTIIAS
ncbi:MAG: response regulator [Candidatus Yonathbacteria bacterium]|nr:response regulator [Candidatus Yonathbacteria bacterium]